MKRILSIDGGGIRGLLPAVLLAALEAKMGVQAGRQFDLLAGTSTGGIIAVALACAIPASRVVNLYKKEGAQVFPRTASSTILSGFGSVGAKYAPTPLEQKLLTIIGVRSLGEPLLAELLIPAYCTDLPDPMDVDGDGIADQASSWFFKSWKARQSPTFDFLLHDVARATSAAPTYFPAAEIMSEAGQPFTFIDGGTFANNPALCALAAARELWPGEDIQIVSLGTGTRVNPFSAGDWGFAQWASHIASVFMDGAADTVSYIASGLMGSKFLRCEMALPPGVDDAFDNCGPDNMAALSQMADVYTKTYLPKLLAFLHN